MNKAIKTSRKNSLNTPKMETIKVDKRYSYRDWKRWNAIRKLLKHQVQK